MNIQQLKESYLPKLDWEISKIHNEELRSFLTTYFNEQVPNYFWCLPASSSLKNHPESDNVVGGLVNHTINVVRVLDSMLRIESMEYDDFHEDCIRAALLLHDTVKYGDRDIENTMLGLWINEGIVAVHTEFSHPILAANSFLTLATGTLPIEMITNISEYIRSHHGQWNTSKYSDVALPLPKDEYAELTHLCDYIASQKWIK